MWKLVFVTVIICILSTQNAMAVHPLPDIPHSCLYSPATPHRPDPRAPGIGTTPEERCGFADTYALSNVPTVPVAVITPSGEPRFYCTLDGSTLADPIEVDHVDEELAESLPGPIPCAGNAVCVELLGQNASCEAFGPDASGSSGNGWVSQGPASSITVAGPLGGELGAHSIYVRSIGGGNIFYFGSGVNRTHSLTSRNWATDPPYSHLPVIDITFCQAPGSTTQQRARLPGCDDFFGCPIVPCCGPHFPCDGAPNFSPLVQSPEDRIAGLDLELESLENAGGIATGKAKSMRKHLSHALRDLDKGKIKQACSQLQHFIKAAHNNSKHGSLESDDAASLSAEASIIRDELGCTTKSKKSKKGK